MDEILLVGLDPSFTNTGIAIADNEKIILTKANLGRKMIKSFVGTYESAKEVSNIVVNKIKQYGGNEREIIIISEIPPPVARFSAGLFCLDSVLFETLSRYLSNLNAIYTVTPNFLPHVHGRRKFLKGESTELANYIHEKFFLNKELIVEGKKNNKFRNDQAEALIFLFYLENMLGRLSNINLSDSSLDNKIRRLLENTTEKLGGE